MGRLTHANSPRTAERAAKLALVLGMVFLTACTGTGSQSGLEPDGGAEEMPAAPERVPIRFLALGDSYTIGESVTPAERWPDQLAALLEDQGIEVGEVQIIARTGWTTGELSAGMDAAGPEGPFDLVSLLIGVNNQYRGLDREAYRADLRDLLRRAIDLAGGEAGRVLVLSIPDWGVTPFAAGRDRGRIAAEIDAYNEINRAEAAEAGLLYVDVTPNSRLAGGRASLIAEDGLHPSGEMYAEWAQLALPAALAALGSWPESQLGQ